jgi:large subunit ribosomal protein L23
MIKHPGTIVTNPRITEKGAYLAEMGCYVFDVAKDANKQQIAEAIKTVFKVVPRKVRVAAVPGKMRATRGTNRKGVSASGKKAYVYLKSGDKIELV